MNYKDRTILLVEDEIIIANAQAQTIRQFGYTVVTVNSGEKAVELAGREESICLILMDINLGKGIDGPETAQQILAKRNIPIVFLTSHAEREMVERVRGITRYGYVIKNSGNFVLQSSIEMAFELFEAHEKSRESEKQYRLLADNASDTIWMMGFDGIFTYHSPAVEKLRGYTPEEANRIPLDQSISPASFSSIQRIIDEERAKPVNERWADRIIELEIYRKDGTIVWTEASVRAIRDQKGHVIGLQGSTRDISKRKRAEEELVLKSLVLDQVEDHVTITDLEGRIIYVNKSQADTLRSSQQEIVGQSTKIYGEDGERGSTQQEILEKTLREGAWQGEVVNYSEDGSEHIMALRTQLVNDESGKPIALCGSGTDITERTLAESQREAVIEALRLSEERLRVTLDATQIAIWDWNIKRDIWYVSPRYYTMLGYEPEEGPSDRTIWLNRVHPQDREATAARIKRILDGKDRHYEYEVRMLHADGSYRWHRVMGSIIEHDEHGTATRMLGVRMDITGHKQAEESLLKSERQLRMITDNIPAHIACVDSRKLRYLFVNRVFADAFGMVPDQLIGKHIREVLGEESYLRALPFIERTRSGERIVFENHVPVDGELRLFKIDYQPEFDAQGMVQNIIVLASDITERKQAEQALRESEEKYRRLFETMVDAFARVDMAGTIQETNKSFEVLLGYTADELRKLTYVDITPEKWHSFESNIIAEQIMVRGYSDVFEKEYIRKDGTLFPVELRTFLIKDSRGQAVGMWAIVRDISERKLAEEKIKSLLAEKELFLKEVHHRIKNNMNTMESMVALQGMRLEEPAAVSVLQDVRSSLQSMMVLYDKLYRSENMRTMSVRDYLPPLVDEIISIFPNSATVIVEKNVDDFVLGVDTISPLGIIVNELLTNAMKHAFSGRNDGVITVSATLRDNRATIIVGDNGKGIPQSVDPGTSAGFGLELVGLLARQIGGTMRIERGRGSRFVLEFEV